MRDLGAELDRIHAEGLYRRLRCVDGPHGPKTIVDGRPVLAFCGNDYLGLANHPGLRAAAIRTIERCGLGSGSAHLINGHTREHRALEEELATFTGRSRALLFSTGYMANLGVAAALAGRGDWILQDRLNHASLLDGGLLSGARQIRYAHADTDALRKRLESRSRDLDALILTDGVFSMDGDLAPVDTLAEIASAHGARLVVDDAHGLGILGARGRGTLEHFMLDQESVPVLVGTFGKAFGTAGAFVAGNDELIDYLIQKARTFIYTTAGPAAVAAATRASLAIACEESWRREKLAALVRRFRSGAAQLGLTLTKSLMPIQPVVVGESDRASALSSNLLSRGILVVAIRPPTVPDGTARLRVTFSASHEEEHVDRLLDALEHAAHGCASALCR